MTFDTQYIQLPRQGRGSSLLLRFIILSLDCTAFICLCVNLGFYHKWVSKGQDIKEDSTLPDYYGGETTYQDYQENFVVPSVRYWEDPIVIVVVLFSFTWTAFIYLRPAWTRKAFHLGAKIACELLLFSIILACSVPAFIFSPLQPAKSMYLYEDADEYCIESPNNSVYYCGGDVVSLQRLQVAAYALVWAVA